MRRFLSITKKPIDQTKSLTAHWLTALSKIKDSLPTTMRRDQEKALVSKSDLASTLESLKGILLAEEQNYAGGIGPCLEYCLENKFFETLVSEAYLDRPKGVFQVVLRFLTGLVDGIRKQLLLPHRAFHGPVTDFLLYVSEHMKKGGEFDSAEMVNLLHAVACAVHINPSYATFFYRVCGARIEYMPLPILLTYFREESQCEQPKLRESLLLCTLLEDKEVVAHILRDTDIIQVLILKLGSYFQTLPQICNPGEPTDATGIEELRKYVTFLNSLCEQCLWKELLSEVGSVFQTIFCDGILSPRLQHSESGIRSTCTLYLTTLVRAVTSPVLLMPLVYYLRGKKPRDCMYLPTPRGRKSMPFEDDSGPMTPRTEVRLTSWSTLLENLDSRNDGLRLRSLQILYSLMEKRQWRILKTLFVESFRPSPTERPIRIKDFFQAYHGWMNEEAMNESYLQCHSYIFTSILSRNESYTRSRHSLVSTGETESTSKVREDTGGMYPAPYVECGELLTILIRKMKQLEVNTFQENVLLTVLSI